MITAQFNDSFPPIIDGVANGVKNYAYWLNKISEEAYVVVPEFPYYKDNEEFTVIRYKSIPFLPRKPYRIGLHSISFDSKKHLSEIPFDLIHSHSPFSSGIFARQVAKEKAIPHVTTFHSQYYYDLKDKLLSERITKRMVKKIVSYYDTADVVWTVNKSTAKTLKDYGYKGDIDIIKNGTDFELTGDYDIRRHEINERYNVCENDFVMLYTGQIIWHKNLRLITESLSEIRKKGKNFSMFFVGKGDAFSELEKLIDELKLNDCVIMTGQISDRNLLKSFYARADLFLFPSVYDTFGQVVREAAALKCPSVLIRGSNAAEDIIDMHNGFLCENTKESFTKKIMDIMESNIYNDIGENARNTLPVSWEKIVTEVYTKYKEIINDFQKSRSH